MYKRLSFSFTFTIYYVQIVYMWLYVLFTLHIVLVGSKRTDHVVGSGVWFVKKEMAFVSL